MTRIGRHYHICFGLLLSLTTGYACGEACPPIAQTVYVTAPDEELQRLGQDCLVQGRSRGFCAKDEVGCLCRPLCLRVLELIDGFNGAEKLETCEVDRFGSTDPDYQRPGKLMFREDAIVVSLTYTPSTCDEQAR